MKLTDSFPKSFHKAKMKKIEGRFLMEGGGGQRRIFKMRNSCYLVQRRRSRLGTTRRTVREDFLKRGKRTLQNT